MSSGSEKNVQQSSNASGAVQTSRSELEETRSFLNNLPEIKKPQPKRNVLDEHLAFINSLPRVSAEKPAVEPVDEVSPHTVTLAGVREVSLDVHEGTESPNRKSSANPIGQTAPKARPPQPVVLDEETEHSPAASEKAINV